jgi:hypothetical protein
MTVRDLFANGEKRCVNPASSNRHVAWPVSPASEPAAALFDFSTAGNTGNTAK